MADTCVDQVQPNCGWMQSAKANIGPPPGLEMMACEYAVGDKVVALRSNGSWSEGTVAQLLFDKITVMLPSGTKQIRKALMHTALKKVETAPAHISQGLKAQLAYRMAALEIQNAQLSHAKFLMRLQSQDTLSHPMRVSEKCTRTKVSSKTGSKPVKKVTFEEDWDNASTASGSGSLDQLSDGCDEPLAGSVETTVMMRNIPNNLKRCELLQLLDDEGFQGHYDFLYLPVDLKSKSGLGYAFVNLVSHESALAFTKHFDGYLSWAVQSEKVCKVAWSEGMQGLDTHVERYRNSPVMHEACSDELRPVLFNNGVRAPFPPPTKNIRPPRVWSRRR
jgi:hypothetical protein